MRASEWLSEAHQHVLGYLMGRLKIQDQKIQKWLEVWMT